MRRRGSICRFASYDLWLRVCMNLVPTWHLQTVYGRATYDLFPRSTPLVPRAPSALSAFQLAIAMGTFPALTHTRFHLCYRRCIVYCVLRAEIERSSLVSASHSRARVQSGRNYGSFIGRSFPPFSSSYFRSHFFLSLQWALRCVPARTHFPLTVNRLTSASPPLTRHSGYGTHTYVPSRCRLTFGESPTPAVWLARHPLPPSFFPFLHLTFDFDFLPRFARGCTCRFPLWYRPSLRLLCYHMAPRCSSLSVWA